MFPYSPTAPPPAPNPPRKGRATRAGGGVGFILQTPGEAGAYQYIAPDGTGALSDHKIFISRHISSLDQFWSHH